MIMGDMQQHLTTRLENALNPSYLKVINESHHHSGAATESHFKLVVVSDYFNHLKLLDRHRFINELFKTELADIHALAIHTYTPDEWHKKATAPDSPKCTSKQ